MQATAPEVIQHASSEASFRRTTTPSFALATPYTGGNLGDGAIMDAVISNIRRRLQTPLSTESRCILLIRFSGMEYRRIQRRRICRIHSLGPR